MAETQNTSHLVPQVRFELEHPSLVVGLVHARGVRVHASTQALLAAMEAAEQAVQSDPQAFPETTRAAIRDLLRVGGYKPTGRGKPASEFLLGAAREAGMPRVNNLVDINNLASLKSAHPISIFDFARLGHRDPLRAARGTLRVQRLRPGDGPCRLAAGVPRAESRTGGQRGQGLHAGQGA
jgi:DNA/RNA-binding domain of Phe-tRNA-synthetase-like protein